MTKSPTALLRAREIAWKGYCDVWLKGNELYSPQEARDYRAGVKQKFISGKMDKKMPVQIALAALTSAEAERDAVIEEARNWRRDEVQAIGAALSNRSWHELETAYNALRDKMDRAAIRAMKDSPNAQ